VKVADADFGDGVRVSAVIATIAVDSLVKARQKKKGKAAYEF
jgi:hypothetical protein